MMKCETLFSCSLKIDFAICFSDKMSRNDIATLEIPYGRPSVNVTASVISRYFDNR